MGGVSLSAPEYRVADSQPQLEAVGMFRHAGRIARGLPPKPKRFFSDLCLVISEIGIIKGCGALLKSGMEL
jgi:ATP-dependent DNA helicase HFM1/MER3